MFCLQNCQIGSLEMLSAHFDFRELYDLLKSEDAYLFAEFARPYRTASMAMTKLLGIHDMKGKTNPRTGAIRCIEEPQLCLEQSLFDGTPVFQFQECEGKPCVKVYSVPDLVSNIYMNSQELYERIHGKGNQNDLTRFRWLESAIQKVVDEVTEQGGRLFTYEAATELYIYLLLHMLAAVPPNKPESLEVLRQDLNRLCPVSIDQLRNNKVIDVFAEDGQSCATIRLEYYTGEQPNGEPLSIVELRNASDREMRFVVEGTELFRKVPRKESVFVLRKGKEFVSFIPRFRLSGEMAMFIQNGALCNVWKGHTERLQTSAEQPASWAQSSQYGTFVVGRNGKLDETLAWPDVVPGEEIVFVDAFGLDYCMLLSNGKAMTQLPKGNWEGEDFISVSLNLNSAIAINARREAVLADGRRIADIRPVEARVRGGHYICLDAQGEIVTDSGLRSPDKVRAVALCEKGYVLALENEVRLVGFDNACVKQWKISDATELEVSPTRIGYYDVDWEDVKFLEF